METPQGPFSAMHPCEWAVSYTLNRVAGRTRIGKGQSESCNWYSLQQRAHSSARGQHRLIGPVGPGRRSRTLKRKRLYTDSGL